MGSIQSNFTKYWTRSKDEWIVGCKSGYKILHSLKFKISQILNITNYDDNSVVQNIVLVLQVIKTFIWVQNEQRFDEWMSEWGFKEWLQQSKKVWRALYIQKPISNLEKLQKNFHRRWHLFENPG